MVTVVSYVVVNAHIGRLGCLLRSIVCIVAFVVRCFVRLLFVCDQCCCYQALVTGVMLLVVLGSVASCVTGVHVEACCSLLLPCCCMLLYMFHCCFGCCLC